MGTDIETVRLVLRRMRSADIEDLLCVFGDPKVMAAFGVPPFDRQQMERWVQVHLDHQSKHGYGLFSVIHKADGVLIGDCGLEQMEVEGATETELGYDFRSDYWHQGLATEAAIAVRDYGFRDLHLQQLISLIRVGNHPSRRVAERIGMTCVGELTRYDTAYWKYAIDGPDFHSV